jgi:hypothetical protein
MIINLAPGGLETQVKGLRQNLTANSTKPGVMGMSCRLALACFPNFLVAAAAEIKNGATIEDLGQAAADVAANIIATVASTAHGDSEDRTRMAQAMLDQCAPIIARQFGLEDGTIKPTSPQSSGAKH